MAKVRNTIQRTRGTRQSNQHATASFLRGKAWEGKMGLDTGCSLDTWEPKGQLQSVTLAPAEDREQREGLYRFFKWEK